MRPVRRPLLLAASGAVLAAVLAASPPVLAQSAVSPTDPWAQTSSDVPADDAVRYGVLPNGMQYAILRNATPPGQASFRLRIDAGSLMENEDQLGLAHFMEHMAFNGTTNIPEGELTRIQERLGIAFGADSNAFTAFDQTVYMIEAPSASTETLRTSLRILREQASDALMAADAIDAERGVIEGEERLRNTPGLRIARAQYALLAPGQKLPNRFPIGELEIIRTAPRDRFVDFYRSYYRPERATLVVVGDFDVDRMETDIRAAFESWAPTGPAGPEPDLGEVASRGPEARILVEPGAQSIISLNWVRSPDRLADTTAGRRQALVDYLGVAVLNRRLTELARSDDPPFLQGSAGADDMVDSLHVASVSAAFNPGGWRRALETIEQEQRRLVRYGVSEAELQREILAIREGLRNAVAGAATRQTPQIANLIVDRVNGGDVVTSPATDFALFEQAASLLSAADVNAGIAKVFAGGGPLAMVVSPVEIEGGEAGVIAALESSGRVEIEAPAARAALEWPYADFGSPGTVATRAELPVIGATVVTFENGVRLTVKPTTFRDQQILITVQTGIGERGLPTDEASPMQLASNIFTQGGLGRLSAEELDRVLAGRVWGARFGVAPDSFVLSGATRPEDLELETQVLAAYLTDPGLRAAPFAQIQGVFPQIIAQQMATPAGAFAVKAQSLLASGDARESFPSAETVAGWTHHALKVLLTESLAAGPIEVVMVGDLTVEDAVAAVASTFGALPARGPDPAPLPGSDQLRFPVGVAEPVILTHDGPAEQAMGYVAWPTTDQVEDRTEARRVALLAKVVELRVLEEIREKQAIAYGPGAGSSASSDYVGYGSLVVQAQTAPDKLPAFFAAVDAIAAGLRDTPPTADELERARLPMVEALRRGQATNEYWLNQLGRVAERPDEVEQIQSHLSDLEAVTPADISALARRYLRPETAWRASVVAAPAAASEAP